MTALKEGSRSYANNGIGEAVSKSSNYSVERTPRSA